MPLVLRRPLERIKHAVERETACFLARWELLERREELSNVLLSRHEQEHVFRSPTPVLHAVIGRLERIGTHVEELGKAKCHERLLPDVQAMRALFREDELPLVVAQRHQ